MLMHLCCLLFCCCITHTHTYTGTAALAVVEPMVFGWKDTMPGIASAVHDIAKGVHAAHSL
jgi:hypothetical protein